MFKITRQGFYKSRNIQNYLRVFCASGFHTSSSSWNKQQQKTRKESDFFGELEIPADRLYGVQTQRALLNFPIGSDNIEKLPFALMRGMIISKKVSALVNKDYGLDHKIGDAISKAADEVLSGKIGKEHFPCIIWTSHTAPNMNANEVLSNRAIQLLGGVVGSKKPVHPNDHCNMGQSSNDTFPAAMHIAVAEEIHHNLLPSLECLRDTLGAKCQEFAHIIKTGRTHIQDAIPLTLGQEFSGYCTAINFGIDRVKDTLPRLYMLALGGTAIGTGYTAFDGYDEKCAKKIAEITKLPFVTAPNKFEPIAAHDTMVEVHGSLNTVACSLMKMANDFRLMSSGPRCGLGEITLPANEPGSSIMPGKVNPTQCEAVTMVAAQIIGTQVSVSIGSFIGQFELNVFKAIIGTNVYRSVRILGDVVRCFTKNCVQGIIANEDNIKKVLNESLMLVTAMNQHIGYEKSAAIAKLARAEGIKLREAAVKLGISEKEYDQIVRPEDMLAPEVYKKKSKK